jgi:hypothetical protein
MKGGVKMKSKKLSYNKILVLFCIIVVLVLMTGCDGDDEPIVLLFFANPSTINQGESSTLTWSVSDATTVTITPMGTVASSGSTSVSPVVTTVYTLTATNSTGSVTASVTVTVIPLGEPYGSIEVNSTPSGAKVYLDGVDTGQATPTIFNNVAAGDHTVRLSYYHYKDWEGIVTVVSEQTTYLNALLIWAPEETITIQPGIIDGKDASVDDTWPNTNWGDTSTLLYIGNATFLRIYRSYLQFDLSSVPLNAVILDADLVLYYGFSGVISSLPIGLYEVTESWEENAITWNNQPANSTEVEDIQNIPTSPIDDFVSWDVSDLVKGWYDGIITNYGMALRDTDEASVDGHVGFRSSEYLVEIERPKLIIDYYLPSISEIL